MKRPLIYFDGTHVMLIRAVDVPTPPDPEDKLWEKMGDSPQYKAICDKYNAALEAANKKAIRVDNAAWHTLDSDRWSIRINDNKLIEIIGDYETPQPLPEGLTYEVHDWIKECPSGGMLEAHQFDHPEYAIIKPVQTVETSETTLSALRNKLSPLFNLVAIVRETCPPGQWQNYSEKCDLPAIKELLSKLETVETEDELWKKIYDEVILCAGTEQTWEELRKEHQSKYHITRRA